MGAEVAQSCLALVAPWTLAHDTPLLVEFSRLEHWSGLYFILQGS